MTLWVAVKALGIAGKQKTRIPQHVSARAQSPSMVKKYVASEEEEYWTVVTIRNIEKTTPLYSMIRCATQEIKGADTYHMPIANIAETPSFFLVDNLRPQMALQIPYSMRLHVV
jgi:hypothetical protein